MHLLLLVLLLQGTRAQKEFEKPIDDTYMLSLVRTTAGSRVTLRVMIEEKANRTHSWELDSFDTFKYSYEVVRADRSSVVLWRANDNGFDETYVKLFFDLASKKLLKKTQFVDSGLAQISDAEAERALGVPNELVKRLKVPFEQQALPEELSANPLPQSTYAEFARLRPGRVKDGYDRRAKIEERIEPYQIAGDKIWFGKSFYDGELHTGVGGVGYLDRVAKKYTFLRIPEAFDWSISNLFVEGDTIWAGLVRHPEAVDKSGGLIRHDLKSGATQKYNIPDIIYFIERWRDGLYMTTSNGVYALKGDKLTRYRIEPDLSGKLAVISEQL
jgi:hypothetical protein